MEQREAERAGKTRIPTAFSLPNVGKSWQREGRIGRGSSRSTLYFGWGWGWGFFAWTRSALYGFGQNRKGPRTSAAPLRWMKQHRRANFPPPASHCSPSSLRVSPSLLLSDYQPAVTFSCDRGNKKNNKTGVKRLKRGRTRRKGRWRQRCAPLPSFASL